MMNQQHILLDTCIVRNLFSREKELASRTLAFLANLNKNKNRLYVSQFTHYELLRRPHSDVKKISERLKLFNTVLSDHERIQRATKLYLAYCLHPSTKNVMSSISDIDIFIGSLIFTDRKPLLLTADLNDFPRPFFKERDYLTIEYAKKRGGRAFQCYYYLEADLQMLFALSED